MKRVLTAILAAGILLAGATPAFAQSGHVLCGELDAESCALLQAAAAADATVTEGSYELGFDFGIFGIPDIPVDSIEMRWDQSASYVSDIAYMAELLTGVDADALAAMETDALAAYLGAVVDAVDTEQTVTLNLSSELAAALSSDAPMPIPEEMTLSYAIVDGIGYVNLDDVAAIVPDMQGISGWAGTELAPVLAAILEQAANDPSMQEALAPLAIGIAAGMAGQNMAADQQEFVAQFLNIERGDDVSSADGTAAHFITSIDFVDMATSPGFLDLLVSQSALLEQMGQEGISADDLAELEFLMPMVAPLIFEGLFYEVQQYVSLESNYTVGSSVAMDWDLSSIARLAAMQSGDPSAAPDGEVAIGFTYEVDSSAHNDVGAIAAPEGAFVVPAEAIVQAMGDGA